MRALRGIAAVLLFGCSWGAIGQVVSNPAPLPTNLSPFQFVTNVLESPYNTDATGGSDAASAITSAASDAKTNGNMFYVPKGTYLLNSSVSPVVGNFRLLVDAGATFTGTGLLKFDNLVPAQTGPIFSNDLEYQTLIGGVFQRFYANYFELARIANQNGTNVPFVAIFGEGIANLALGSSAPAWGGNFVGVAAGASSLSYSIEADCDALNAAAVSYCIDIRTAGSSPSQFGVRLAANNANAGMLNGFVVDGTTFSAINNSSGFMFGVQGTHVAAGKAFDVTLGTYGVAEYDGPSLQVGATNGSAISRVQILPGTGAGAAGAAISVIANVGGATSNGDLAISALGTGKITPTSPVTATSYMSTNTTTAPAMAAGVLAACGACTPALAANNEGIVSTSSGSGLILQGEGSNFDVLIRNKSLGSVLGVPTGTTTVGIIGSISDRGFDPENITGSTFTLSNSWHTVDTDSSTNASLTVTMPPTPTNGQLACFANPAAIVTALTFSANSGQSIVGGLSAVTASAGSGYCYLYQTSNTTWYRVQ